MGGFESSKRESNPVVRAEVFRDSSCHPHESVSNGTGKASADGRTALTYQYTLSDVYLDTFGRNRDLALQPSVLWTLR